MWSHRRDELFYLAPSPALVGATPKSGGDWSSGAVVRTKLFDVPGYVGGVASRVYGVMPDADRFLFIKPLASTSGAARRTDLVLVQNWLEDLKRVVPTN